MSKNAENASNGLDEETVIEDQFILRLPPQQAKFIHQLLINKPKQIKKYLKIDLKPDTGEASIQLRKKLFEGKLRNLPTIIESYKTVDKVYLFKTADICQMLDCTKETLNDPSLNDPHGITPPLKNVRKRRFRKCQKNDRDEELDYIEKEVYFLLKTDLEAVSTRFELFDEHKNELIECNEEQLFGCMSSSSEEENEENRN